MSDSDNLVELVGTGNSGDFVLQTQGGAEGFRNVSQYWLPKTLTYDEMMERLQRHYDRRKDVLSPFGGFKAEARDKGIVFIAQGGPDDGAAYTMTEHALGQYLGRLDIPRAAVFDLLNDRAYPNDAEKVKISRDLTDRELAVEIINNGLRHFHSRGDNAKKKFRFRTYDDTKQINAVLTERYSCVDNRWYLNIVNELIPGGRYSHFSRANDNTIYGNVLIPDSIREEKDSEYGGMLSLSNCEIGIRELEQYPSIFRAICMNGCIWDRSKGVRLKKRHIGLELNDLKVEIVKNLTKQIRIAHDGIDKLLATDADAYKAGDVKMARIFAAVGERFKLSKKHVIQSQIEWSTSEKESRSLFGVVNAVTRAGQKFDNAQWVQMDEVGGDLTRFKPDDWNSLLGRAKSFTETEVQSWFSDKKYLETAMAVAV